MCCRRKLDGSSIAKVIAQAFSRLVVVWFYIFFGFQFFSLSFFLQLFKFSWDYSQGVEQMRESLSLCELFALHNVSERTLQEAFTS